MVGIVEGKEGSIALVQVLRLAHVLTARLLRALFGQPSPTVLRTQVSDSEQTCRQQDIDDSGTVTEQGNNILHSNPNLRERVQEATGSCTVPQVFIGGQHIGGATELQTLQRSGKLSQLLAEENASSLPTCLQECVAKSTDHAQANGHHLPAPPALSELAHQLHGDLSHGDYAQHQVQLHQAFKDLAADMQHPQKGVRRRCHSTGFFQTAKSAFTFQEAIDWLAQQDGQQQQSKPLDHLRALQQLKIKPIELLSALQKLQLVTVVHPSGAHVQALQGRQGHAALLRLTRDCPWTSPGHALNGHFFWHGMARPAVEVAGSLRLSILGLYERHLADDGSLVDYKGLRKDHAFADYINATAELQQVDLSAMSNPERKAFWINLYNMMVIHALTTWGPPSSFLQRLSWFGKIKYTIGGYDYSTNDVEHGMLRANGPSPVSLPVLLGQTQWAAGSLSCDDPRLAFSMEQRDPRIHFALVCGAKSCPPIKIYTAENLEEGLDAAASAFCSDDIQIDVASKEIRLSKIFKWYEMDFGTSNQMLLWLCSHLTSQKQQALQQLLKAPTDIRFSYRPYDWDINSR
ncbi:hypothetical protein WJX74_008384 [Apatococcus lobatus]|uniref:DUF547 domain-containing protein n=1 Tax=Apatococcus lobatus TaxID=904363 RepID=A0AAW1S3G1_9CHLO